MPVLALPHLFSLELNIGPGHWWRRWPRAQDWLECPNQPVLAFMVRANRYECSPVRGNNGTLLPPLAIFSCEQAPFHRSCIFTRPTWAANIGLAGSEMSIPTAPCGLLPFNITGSSNGGITCGSHVEEICWHRRGAAKAPLLRKLRTPSVVLAPAFRQHLGNIFLNNIC